MWFKCWSCVLLFMILSSSLGDLTNAEQSSSVSDCESNEFQCTDGQCILKIKKCDGNPHCADSSDEENCGYECKEPDYICKGTQTCITQDLRCNGEPDCPSGDDEIVGCNVTISQTVEIMSNTNCVDNDFECKDHMCISKNLLCDAVNHCFDGADENNELCLRLKRNCTGGFQCKNFKCLSSIDWICDGKDDCGDKSDEQNCNYNLCDTEHNKFQCGSKGPCLSLEKACDGIKDCPDASDESDICNKQNCTTIKCPELCHILPTGAVCTCKFGFKYDPIINKCIDVNECKIYGICTQMCQNTVGSHECKCIDKFELDADKQTCKSIVGQILYYSTKRSINGYNFKENKYFQVLGVSNVYSFETDGIDLYYIQQSKVDNLVVKTSLLNNDTKIIASFSSSGRADIKVDWITKNIYVVDVTNQRIFVCDSQGDHCFLLKFRVPISPIKLVLDSHNGIMYWSDNKKIFKANMDGSNIVEFAQNRTGQPRQMFLDWPNERLYWIDGEDLKGYRSIDVYENNFLPIRDFEIINPTAIAIGEDRFFWSDRKRNIYSCNKFTGKKLDSKTLMQSVLDISIFANGLTNTKNIVNPCATSKCSHLCVISGNKNYKCLCSETMSLDSDQLTCIQQDKPPNILLGVTREILIIEPLEINDKLIHNISESDFTISHISYNTKSGDVIFADNDRHGIFIANYQHSGIIVQIVFNTGYVTSLSYDYLANNLYWSDSGKSTIEVFSFQESSHAIIKHFKDIAIPFAIAVIPEKGSMLLAIHSNLVTNIDRLNLNGVGDQHHIHSVQKASSDFSFAVDPSIETVFWVSGKDSAIMMMDYDGLRVKELTSTNYDPSGITVAGSRLYWVSRKSKYIHYLNKLTGSIHSTISTKFDKSYTKSLSVMSPRIERKHPCLTKNNGGCSDICVSNGINQNECVCLNGREFQDKNNRVCIDHADCFYKCKKTGQCVKKSQICDKINDCVGGDDEADCKTLHSTAAIMCQAHEFLCIDKSDCIGYHKVCDQHFDCADHSDEIECGTFNHTTKCTIDQFVCNNGKCIDMISRCDTERDCDDGSDENDCSRPCASNQFQCNSGQCININWLCDGEIDCVDSSDEPDNCTSKIDCDSNHFRCKNMKCIDKSLRCNNFNDCDDGSDESDCPSTSSNDNYCKSLENGDELFQCQSNKTLCLPKSALCNGTAECPRGEDELNCSICLLNEFECLNTKCIDQKFVCDADDDCGDMSDEINCDDEIVKKFKQSTEPSKFTCPEGMYDCENNKCIDKSLLCNGNDDCGNRKDEGGLCSMKCIRNNNCEHHCRETPKGTVCYCNDGYKLAQNARNCNDIDECKESNPCPQKCINIVGAYNCSCYPGFIGKSTCKAKGLPHYMLFSTGNQIRNMSSSIISVIDTNTYDKITGISFDNHENVLYYTVKSKGIIYQHNMKTNQLHFVKHLEKPGKISLDWITKNIYVVEYNTIQPRINVCNFNKLQCSMLLQLNKNDIVMDIAVDPINKLLFYVIQLKTLDKIRSTVHKSYLDGTRAQLIANGEKYGYSNEFKITSLSYDFYKKIVYFTESNTNALYSVRYDGTDIETVHTRTSAIRNPTSVDVFEDRAFILNLGTKSYAICPLYGTKKCRAYELFTFNGENVEIVQSIKQKMITNECDNSNCSVTCVPAGTGPKCVCYGGSQTQPKTECYDSSTAFNKMFIFDAISLKQFESNQSTSSTGLIFIFLLMITGIIAGYILYRKNVYKHGQFNINMHFQNPNLKDSESAHVNMINAPEFIATHQRNEIFINPSTNYPKKSPRTNYNANLQTQCQRNDLFAVLSSSLEEIDSLTEDTDSMDNTSQARLILSSNNY